MSGEVTGVWVVGPYADAAPDRNGRRSMTDYEWGHQTAPGRTYSLGDENTARGWADWCPNEKCRLVRREPGGEWETVDDSSERFSRRSCSVQATTA